ncbi:protein white-like [Palaemon carinicauda]|uniref:protein white-like n=1 Tax=Palaemon carinicauda TaxID=392227 RepID=UPI0035B66E58
MSGAAGYDNPAFLGEAKDSVVHIDQGSKGSRHREKLSYSWEDLNVFAPVIQGCFKKSQVAEKHILRNVTGICRPGELLAVMGASGAGKTTLLNCLNFRCDPGLKIKGKLFINGRRVTPELLTSRSAYVQQEDIFVGTITVKEQLVFQANLRMDKHLSRTERMQRVEDVMVEVNNKL